MIDLNVGIAAVLDHSTALKRQSVILLQFAAFRLCVLALT